MKYFLSIVLALAANAGVWGIAAADTHAIATEYQQLLKQEPQLAGQIAFDLRLGDVALKANDPSAAVFAFQRVLTQEPDNAEAHLGIARAYFDLGEDASSRRHFELLYAVADLETQRFLQTYLTALDQRSGVRKPTTAAYAALKLGYDDNITQIRDGQPPGSFGVFAIQSSRFSNAAFGIKHQRPIGAVWHWQAAAKGEYEKYHDFSDYDLQRLGVNGGAGGRINAWRWNTSLGLDEIRRDNQRLYSSVAVAGVAEHRVDGFWKKVGLRLQERDYGGGLGTRDVDGYEMVFGVRHAGNNIRWTDLSLDVYWGDESAKNDPANTFGRDYITAKLRWYVALRSTLRLVAGYDYSNSEFKDNGAQTFIPGVSRDDDFHSLLVRLSMANLWCDGLDLDIEISRDENRSNISTLSFDRDRISIGLRYHWGV